ncbi:hypothetical protein cand_031310 [Cryptosporidium andersoni]|uniref:Uncharacterized protein n=1 Tax=Cryptosporidium andersoni TaxID=117008 RepID=A0A1J4MCJ0_9CRYT|nr:hypothetical protein cand_031310 [Cryptosporidium andersoni]
MNEIYNNMTTKVSIILSIFVLFLIVSPSLSNINKDAINLDKITNDSPNKDNVDTLEENQEQDFNVSLINRLLPSIFGNIFKEKIELNKENNLKEIFELNDSESSLISDEQSDDSRNYTDITDNQPFGPTIQELLTTDLIALGIQAIIKRKYHNLRFSQEFSFESLVHCFEPVANNTNILENHVDVDKFVKCCTRDILDLVDLRSDDQLSGLNINTLDICIDLRNVLEDTGIAFRFSFIWISKVAEKSLGLSGPNLVMNLPMKYSYFRFCNIPRLPLDIVFDVDQTLLTMIPVSQIRSNDSIIMVELNEIPNIFDRNKDYNFAMRRSSDNIIKYSIPHEVHLNPQAVGLLFSLYYRRIIDPCIGSLTIFSAGYNTVLKFKSAIDIENVLGSSRYHLHDIFLELFPDDNEIIWATERPALMTSRDLNSYNVQLPPVDKQFLNFNRSRDFELRYNFIDNKSGFQELVYNGLPFFVKDMQRYRLHITLQKGKSSQAYQMLVKDLNPTFLRTLRKYQTMKRYPIMTHPFNSPLLYENNRPMILLVDDEILHFTYACSLESWSDNVLIAWTEKLGPIPINTTLKFFLPLPYQHIQPLPINISNFTRELNNILNLDYAESMTYQFSNNNSDKVGTKKRKNKKTTKKKKNKGNVEQFLSSSSVDFVWPSDSTPNSDTFFVNDLGLNSVSPSRLLQIVYPSNNPESMICPYDIQNIKLYYIAMMIPCELFFVLYKNILEENDDNNIQTKNITKLVNMVDMFFITNERKVQECSKFISSISGIMAYKDSKDIFYKRVIYSHIPSIVGIRSLVGLPIQRTLILWLQLPNSLDSYHKIWEEMDIQGNKLEQELQDTNYEPLYHNNTMNLCGTLGDKSVNDAENIIIFEPLKSYSNISKTNNTSTENIEEMIDIVKVLFTIDKYIYAATNTIVEGMHSLLDKPANVLVSQAIINKLIYSICYGIVAELNDQIYLNVCHLGKPPFSRPILRQNQFDWISLAFEQNLANMNASLVFPVVKTLESMNMVNLISSYNNQFFKNRLVFQPGFVGLSYATIDFSTYNDDNDIDEYIYSEANKDFDMDSDLKRYLVDSLSSMDYEPFFVEQCTVFLSAISQVIKNKKTKESNIFRRVNQRYILEKEFLNREFCENIRQFIEEKVPEFFQT